MFTSRKKNNLHIALLTILFVSGLSFIAYASNRIVTDPKVSMSEARVWADQAQVNTEFPITLNESVLKQLNRFLGTVSGREYMRASLARMQNYLPIINPKIGEYQAPQELVAIPIVESGYQNLTASPGQNGAGLWMFIKSTAKNYGLLVNSSVDQRLNVELETDAGMRYLTANHLRFNDWLLAILAYNMGENAVQKAITQTGSRDAWTLIAQGFEGDQDYMAKLMAAIIIIKNPAILQR